MNFAEKSYFKAFNWQYQNPQTTAICCRKHLFLRFFHVVCVRKLFIGNILAESWHLSTIKTEASISSLQH